MKPPAELTAPGMALHEILAVALRKVTSAGMTVTIKRADEHSHEIRFEPAMTARGYRITARHWIDQTPTIAKPSPTSARGTVGPYVGWSPTWSAFMGFSIDSILATDWRFL